MLRPLPLCLCFQVRALPGMERLGKLRDVTINFRHSTFLRLDPHVDPAVSTLTIYGCVILRHRLAATVCECQNFGLVHVWFTERSHECLEWAQGPVMYNVPQWLTFSRFELVLVHNGTGTYSTGPDLAPLQCRYL